MMNQMNRDERAGYVDPHLSPRQQRILEVIDEAISAQGYAPSVREIGEAVGLTSSSSVHAHLDALQRKGYIRRDPTTPRRLIVQAPIELVSGRPEDELSLRQREILDVIRQKLAESGYVPSIKEIAQATRLTSTSSVRAALDELEQRGFLRRTRGKSRAIDLLVDRPSGDRRATASHRPSPALIDATDLALWANRRDAQELLPLLVRRLILTTASGFSRLHFPAGEGVQYGDWDGLAEVSEGNAFVPNGLSVWEISTNRNPKQKAEQDYVKRCGDPRGVSPAEATYVFLTLRRWKAGREWALQKSSEGRWREVRAYDADDLDVWLELSPAVHAWISSLLGKDPEGAQDLQAYWNEWVEATSPPLSADLVIGGREEVAERILQRLTGPPAALALRAHSPEEALIFLAASLHRLPNDERDTQLDRAFLIRDTAAWRQATASRYPLLLVPLFDGANIASALRGGHHVVIPSAQEGMLSDEGIELPSLRRSAAKESLLSMGVPERRADALATVAHRSLLSLRRKLAFSPDLQRPAWAQPNEAHTVLPAMLAGAWNESQEEDREILAALAGHPYDQVARELTRWWNQPDPPVRRVGTAWILVDKEDAWRLLAQSLTTDDLRRLREAVFRVVGAIDPALDLPVEERWTGNILGRTRSHSSLLREGLADTLALLGARTTRLPLAGGSSGQSYAARIVHELLERANADVAGGLWSSLSDVLPLLAEAAPDVFLEAVDEGLSSGRSVLLNLFTDASQQGAFFTSSPHTGLLWALESLAWAADYLGPVALLLARLIRLDPGGRLANRPASSLREILLPWHPQTTAPLDRRLGVLDVLREREPEIAWPLLVRLLPQLHDHALPTHEPRWREWKPEEERRVTVAEWHRATVELLDRLLRDVGTDGGRWQDLVERVPALPKDAQDAIIESLLSLDTGAIDEPSQTVLRDKLREVISDHRRFSNADWAMPEQQVERLAHVYRRLEPDDPVRRYAWLFTHHPDVPGADTHDWQAHRRAIEEAQNEAARLAYEVGGLVTLMDLAMAAEQPREVGRTFGRMRLLRMEESNILAELASPDRARQQLACGYVVGRFYPGDWVWAEAILKNQASEWTPLQRADFLTSLPSSSRTWGWVERFGAETERAYWSQFHSFLEDPNDATRAAAKLLKFGRPHAAVELLGLYAEQAKPDPEALAEALERATQAPLGQDIDPSMWAHQAVELLDYVEASGALDNGRLAQLEWAYLPVLGHRGRPAKVLHRELARDPAFFVEVVSWVFKAEDEEPRDLTAEEGARAKLGYQLLDSWHEIPGRRDDGSIDTKVLLSWVAQARKLLAARGRAAVGDERIGRVLHYGPPDADGVWPAKAIRELIETIASRGLELGLEIEVHNSRGMTWRGPTEGGRQERELAERYNTFAQGLGDQWPRTAALLRRIARAFEAEARREDQEAELREDLWR